MNTAHRLRQSRRLAGPALMAAVICVATGCQSHDSTTPPASPFVISPAAAFAGSTVTIHGSDFRALGTGAAALTIGDTDVTLSRLDDTTMSALVPATAGGVLTPVLKLNQRQVPLAPITVFGFAEMQTFDTFPIEPVVWPRTGHAVIMGFAFFTDLEFIDLDTKTITSYPAINCCLNSPGATYQDSVFVFRSRDDSLEAWRVLPVPTRIASAAGFCCGSGWEALQLGPDRWLRASKYQISTPTGLTSIVQPQDSYMSPRHDRAMFGALAASGGPSLGTPLATVPVFAVPSGTVAYLSPLAAVIGVDFSPDGELLAMVGGSVYIGAIKRIVLLRAATGEILGDTTIDRNVYAVAIDPVRPLLYVSTMTAMRPTVLVLDRSTFRVLGEMQAPAFAFAQADLGSFIQGGVIALNSQNGLYLFWQQTAWRFTLPEP